MKILAVSRKNAGEIARKAAAALKKGKVLACPTDTVYGLLADARSKKAVGKIFQIKQREKATPLPIFVNSIAMAKKFARVSRSQEKFLKKVWPGKVTAVLKSRGVLAKETGTKKTIGLRIPKHNLVQLILQRAKTPLTGTSANLSGEPPLSDSKEIIRQFLKRKFKPDILIDAGKLPYSKPSRVIDIIGKEPRILRK